MAECFVSLDQISVLAPYLFPQNIAIGLQVSDDTLHSPLGDAHCERDLPQRPISITGKTHKHMCVIRKNVHFEALIMVSLKLPSPLESAIKFSQLQTSTVSIS